MTGLNRAYFIGRVGRDPELRADLSGQSRTTLSLAIPNTRKDGDTYVEVTDWFEVVATGKNAEYLVQTVRKGANLAVECRVEPSRWTDADGRSHRETRLVIERVLWVSMQKPAETVPAETAPER